MFKTNNKTYYLPTHTDEEVALFLNRYYRYEIWCYFQIPQMFRHFRYLLQTFPIKDMLILGLLTRYETKGSKKTTK